MLKLHKGRAIRRIVDMLEGMGFAWAYRTIDSRAFGLPQRRRRVILLASASADPRPALLGTDTEDPLKPLRGRRACGFYWTEGNTGIGWAVDAVPPLKGGSAIHIPSPPAIWFSDSRLIATPAIEDAERLQGFPARWTKPAESIVRGSRERWRLVGNAVSVPLAKWLGRRLSCEDDYDEANDEDLRKSSIWPDAAWGLNGERAIANVSAWPVRWKCSNLTSFLRFPTKALSARAAGGFLQRLEASSLHYEDQFARDLRQHVKDQQKVAEAHRPDNTKHKPKNDEDSRRKQRSRTRNKERAP